MADTSARMLTLLSLLQTRRDWPGQLLAERLEISARTVRRDVDRLRELGYRVQAIKGPDGGYRLEPGSELPPLLFDDEQAVALAVALQNAAASGIGEAAERALATVRQVMPSRLRHRIDGVVFTVLPPRADPHVDPEVLLAVTAAVRERMVLRFDYAGALRRAEPQHVISRAGRWYLVAWDLDRDAWRTFRLDRIAPRIPTGPRFAVRVVPGGDVSAFVSAKFKGSEGTDRWPCEGEAILALSAAAVAPYLDDGVVEPLGPDRCRLRLGSWSWIALAAALARFDAEVEVVSPPELSAAFAELAERFGRMALR